jgi:uncharacterized protein
MSSPVETVRALFNALARFDNAAIAAVLHDGLRYELPFEPDMPTLDKAGLLRMLMDVTASFQRFEMNIVETIEAADPQRVVVRYDGDCLSKDGSVSYCNNYIGLFTVVDGQITETLEYANPLVAREMFEQLSAIEPG